MKGLIHGLDFMFVGFQGFYHDKIIYGSFQRLYISFSHKPKLMAELTKIIDSITG